MIEYLDTDQVINYIEIFGSMDSLSLKSLIKVTEYKSR